MGENANDVTSMLVAEPKLRSSSPVLRRHTDTPLAEFAATIELSGEIPSAKSVLVPGFKVFNSTPSVTRQIWIPPCEPEATTRPLGAQAMAITRLRSANVSRSG